MGEEIASGRHPGVDGKDSRRRRADPRATWQALAESPYARLALKTGPGFYSALAELISPPENAWLLDVGCDSGELDVALAERFCASYVTGDGPLETHIRRANRLSAKRLAANCSFVRANPSRLPFGEASFDIAIGVAVLRYWQDPRKCLHEMRRVLVPDGLLYLAELDLDHTERRARGNIGRRKEQCPQLRRAHIRASHPQGRSRTGLLAAGGRRPGVVGVTEGCRDEQAGGRASHLRAERAQVSPGLTWSVAGDA